MIWCLPNTYIRTPNIYFFEKTTLGFRLLLLRDISLFPNLTFVLHFDRTLIPEYVYRPWHHLRFVVEKVGET